MPDISAARLLIYAAVALMLTAGTWHARGIYDAAKKEQQIEAQDTADKLKQQQLNDKLADDDQKTAAARQQSTSLNQTWSAQRAKEITNDCPLPTAGIGMLKQAIAAP